MSGADRKEIRIAATTALADAPYFDGFTQISAWVQSVDVDALPAWAVATPSERRDGSYSDGRAKCELTLAVVVKRIGSADIEDFSDDDADAVEAAIAPAIRRDWRMCELTQTETRIDGDGARRVASLTMAFTVTYWTDDPA